MPIWCISLVALFALPGATAEPARVSRQQKVMGTSATVVACAPDRDRADRALAAAFAELQRVEHLFSRRAPASVVSRVNRDASARAVPVGAEVFAVLDAALKASAASDGAFDVTVGPLIELWKQAGQRNRLPTGAELADARRRVGWRHVRLDRERLAVRFGVAGMRVDLGGIAKGYGIDRALAELKRHGLTAGLVDVGGDLAVFGSPPGQDGWRVGVQSPFDPGHVTRLLVRDGAVTTSGNYFRFSTIADTRYSHILDPRTGRPADAVPSVTVIAPTAMHADWLATALSVLGPPALPRLVEAAPNVEALLILGRQENTTFARSTGFARYEMDVAATR